VKLKTFVVEGTGQFPYDMLRYVPCWPAGENDSVALAGDSYRWPSTTPARRITLETFSAAEIVPRRWTCFGDWKVVQP